MKRDILNHLDEKIGELELPDNTPEEVWKQKLDRYKVAPAAPPPFADVTPRQIRQALVMSGVSIEQIENAINSLPEPTRSMAKIEWEYSTSFQRSRPITIAVATILGWNAEQLNDLWKLAASLQ